MALSENDVQNITGIMSGKDPVTPTPQANPNPPANQETATQESILEQPGITTTGDQTQQTDQPETGQAEEQQVEEINLEDLGFESIEHLQQYLDRYDELEAENNRLSVYKDGPQFKSDRHKLLYDLGAKVEGMELEAARQLLNVVALDLTKLSDQQIRFEAFKMKPENKGYAQDELLTLFKEEDLNRFGDPSDQDSPQTESQKIRLRQATSLAKEELMNMQNNWNQARAAEISPRQAAEDMEAYRNYLLEQTSGFDGIQLDLAAQDENGEKLEGLLNYKVDPDRQWPEILEALSDPNKFWDELLEEEEVVVPGRPPDINKFAAIVTFVKHRYEIANSIYQQGREDERAHRLKKARNVADPTSTGITPAPEQKQKSERQQMLEAAMKTVGQL